ncbi:tail fiber domain-containing protein [Stenotrophomonas bentonitica]|uniref:tail fiber domain-containing protein n=1 Tax=Stenotrophomonas bentonitica TaxID=1450134 RepID=UPI00345E6F62
MARQIIDNSPPNGDPAPTAFGKCNLNFAELYQFVNGQVPRPGGTYSGPIWMTGVSGAFWWQDRTGDRDFAAYSQGNVWRLASGLRGAPTADLLTMDAGGNLTFQGRFIKPGVYTAENYRIFNTGVEQGIGGTFDSWNGSRQPAVQVDAQLNTVAYMPFRVTNWGVKHLFTMDIYQGGAAAGATTTCNFHFDTATNRHSFLSNGSMVIAGTLTQNSDYRIKADVETISPTAAAAAMRLARPVEYTDTEDTGKRSRRAGFIAHEFQENFPLLVHGQKDETQEIEVAVGDTRPFPPGEEPEDYVPPTMEKRTVPKLQNVNYAGSAPYLMAAWQEHDGRIERLEAALSAALDRIAALESAA